VAGFLGASGEVASRGLVELAPAVNRLSKTSFRSSPALLKQLSTVSATANPTGWIWVSGESPRKSRLTTAIQKTKPPGATAGGGWSRGQRCRIDATRSISASASR
jgi:hypothetical protein